LQRFSKQYIRAIPGVMGPRNKTKLITWIIDVAAIANAKGKWIEPFPGTGVVAFNPAFKEALLMTLIRTSSISTEGFR
jgi:hypothetical protein